MREDVQELLDVTPDIVNGVVNRRLNAVSDMQLTLQNKNGRYTKQHVIKPMDRIIVRMSRVGKPFLVFSGFVDDAPSFQLYPGTVTLAASCTLKLLQHTMFDPGALYVHNWFTKYGWSFDPDSGSLYVGIPGVGNNDLYGTVGDIIAALLTDIANWPKEAITIYDLPTSFLTDIAKLMQSVSDSSQDIYEQNTKLLAKLFGTNDINPSGTSPSIEGDTGNLPSSGNIDIVDVARLALKAGFAGDNAVTAVAVARAESGFITNAMGFNFDGSYDTGLWQINSVHTAGGKPLPAPPGGVGTLNMPKDWNAIKASIPASPRTYIESMWKPSINAAEAFSIFQGAGLQFTPWATYNNNLHQPYMSAAAAAIKKAKLTPDVTLPATKSASTAPADSAGSASSDSPQRQGDQSANADIIATKIVQIAQTQIGVHGSGGNNYGTDIEKYQNYVGISQGQPWCAAFASWIYGQAGLKDVKSGAVAGLEALGQKVNQPQAGDMIHWGDDHVGIVTAVNGKTVSFIAGNNGEDAVGQGTATVGAVSSGFGVAPTFLHFAGVGKSASYVGTGTLTKEDVLRLGIGAGFFAQQLQGSELMLSTMLTGRRALANDISLMEWIDNLVPSSGRVYSSTPSGSFLAFFPDRWGFFERTPYFYITDTEIVDLTINENDTNLTTHVFTTGPINPTAGIQNYDRMNSMVASVEEEAFKFFIHPPKDFSPIDFLARYGARPYPNDIMNVNNPLLLWMSGWMKFMELWSKRFTATASFTFMPELFPGGRVSLGDRVEMFIESTTHTFDLAGGFSTSAELSSIVDQTGTLQDITDPSQGFGPQRQQELNP